MNTYLHTQRAGRWLVVPLCASLAMVLAAFLTELWPILTGVPVLGLMAWLFASILGTDDAAGLIAAVASRAQSA